MKKVGGGLYSTLSQDILFWRLAYELVRNYRFRVLKMSEQGELWLEQMEGKNKNIVRLLRYDIDWGNWLLHDIEQTEKVIRKYKEAPYRKKMNAYNIYISTYPPVDDWEHRLDRSIKTNMFLIVADNRENEVCAFFERLHLPEPNVDEWLIEDIDPAYYKQAIREIERQRNQSERVLLFGKKPRLTYIFVALNMIMFFLLELAGSSTDIVTLVYFGAKYNPAILDGEWWRFITPMLLHIGFAHLFMNTLALYYLGLSVERIYGSLRFFLIYILAGISGVTASFAFTDQVSAGASGAIFGLFGALLYFGIVYPSLFFRTMGMNVFAVLAINLAFGFIVPMVDNSAHIGGLIGGFLASAFVHLPKHKPLFFRQLSALFLLAIIIGATIAYGFLMNGS